MSRIQKIACALSLIILASCLGEKDIASSTPLDIIISLQKTPCYGSCSVYLFQVLNDGSATLTVGGMASDNLNLNLPDGKYLGQLSNSEIEEVVTYAENNGYFDFNEKYDDARVMDLPATISLVEGHKVFNRFEGPNLDGLYSLIESKISGVLWTKTTEN